jgi:hypothetical protein
MISDRPEAATSSIATPGAARRGRRKNARAAEASIPNRPARYPPYGAWPAELRADITAAFLDFPTTRALAAAILEGDAPRASGVRGEGPTRELTWHLEGLKAFVASRHGGMAVTSPGARLIDVIPRVNRPTGGATQR